MKTIQVNDTLTSASQPSLEEIARLRDQGYTTFVNCRPDGEDGDQPGDAAERAAAEAAGLTYHHIPVTGPTITEADIRAFSRAFSAAAGAGAKVFGHCKGGGRPVALWALGEVLDGRLSAGDLDATGDRLGVDLKAAKDWLTRSR
ncbi:TIGR01244 family sulfur transferase [Methylobacterium nonmethylotrophicum]|uniref:TIGR01244 family sulfur transferase n=1 Tax=Methylobacterium nonmethylotrophicum TaxID=1141884 RepID=UPI0014369299|nr:TIGR01244 family sulfur transferase [Methylobacterium nonmethylotrophicum]